MEQKRNLQFFILSIFIFVSIPFRNLTAQADLTPIEVVYDTICSNNLDTYSFLGKDITQPGIYEFPIMAIDSTDSVVIRLDLFAWPNQHDTIHLADCVNNFPIKYDERTIFNAPGQNTMRHSTDTNGCDIFSHFIIEAYPFQNDTLHVNICEKDLPYVFGNDTLFKSDTITHDYVNAYDCDSIVTLFLTVNPVYEVTDTVIATMCSFDLPYTYQDSSFYNSGIYDFEIHTVSGCDSAKIHLELTVLQTPMDTIIRSVCSDAFPFELDSNNFFDEPGIYYVDRDDTLYCHPITMLVLNSLPLHNDTLIVDLCETDSSFFFADSVFTESTIYTINDTTRRGCDSITTLVLNIHPSYQEYDTMYVQVCRFDLPYTYMDSSLTEEGSYDFEIPTAEGCDSLHRTINFSILDNPQDTVDITVCANDFPFLYKDTLIDSAGTYFLSIASDSIGCDTLRWLTVNEAPTHADSVFLTVCANEPYSIGDTILTEPGIYDILLKNQYGCDSLITITFNHYPVFHQDTLAFTTCENDLPFTYGDSTFTTAGTYEVYFQSENGCDSVITIQLNINPIIYNSDTLQQEICANELPYMAFGRELTEAGTYTFTTYSQVTGCDSIFFYRLIVHENPAVSIQGADYLCDGSQSNLTVEPAMTEYLWNTGFQNQMLEISNAGNYSVTVTNVFGCKGTASKQVERAELPNIQITGDVAICYGDSAVLTVTGGNSYRWENGSTANHLVVYPTSSTTYKVTGTDNTPCSNESQFSVTVRALPTPSISGVQVICEGESTQFSVSNSNAYLWSTGQRTKDITIQNGGTYSVTVTDQYGCQGTAMRDLTVNPKPEARISGASHFCSGGSSNLKAEPASTSYLWSFNDLSDQSITITEGGNYSVTITNEFGCSNTAQKQISIDTLPKIVINGSQVICKGESATLTVTGSNNYIWDNGSSDNQIIVYPTENTTYRVTGTNNTSCSNKNSFTISVRDLPVPTITSNKSAICQGDSAVFTANAGSQSSSYTYLWSNEITSSKITVRDANHYTVTVTDAYGCQGTASHNLVVNENPNAAISGINHFCEGGSTTLKAMPDGCSFIWSDNGMMEQSITVSQRGTYMVTVTNSFGCKSIATKEIVTDTLPKIIINGNTSICKGDSAVINVSGANNYRWDNGSSASRIVVYPIATTTYRVTGTNNTPCSNESAFTISVRDVPVPTITSSKSAICQGDSAIFSVTSSSQSSSFTYLWSNNSSSNKITVRDANHYTVTVTDAYGCQGSASHNLVVNENPYAVISGVNHFCEGGSTTLKALPDGCSYIWSNDGLTEQSINISQSGTYKVTVTNSFGCKSFATQEIVTDTLPRIILNGNTSICNGDSAVITVSGANSYHWDNGSTASRIVVYPTSTTTYKVTGTNNTPCSNESGFTINVRSLPTASISGNNDICQQDSTIFIATGGSTYKWSTGAQGDRITVRNADIYTVTATDQYGCSSTTTRSLTVNRIPDVRINGSSLFCQGRSTSLTAVGAQSYEWQETGDVTQSITVNQPGTYTVIGTSDKGCKATASKTISTTQVSNVSFTGKTSFCHGQSTSLGVIGNSDYSYEWNNGLSSSTIMVTTPGLYSVTITDEHNCQKILTTTIVENPLPTPTISGNLEICEGNTTKLTASGGQTYLWDGNVQTPSMTVNATGNYTVTVTNINGCTATASAEVTVYPKPIIQIMSSRDHVCSSTESITLRAIVTNGRSYFWSTGQETQSITVTPGTTNTYNVYVIDEHNCANTNSTTIQVSPEITPYIIGNTNICQGNTTTLTASSNALTPVYQWSNHQSNSSISVNTSGNYVVTVTDNSGCTGTAQVFVNVHELPNATISDRVTICEGDTATLAVQTNDNNSIIWRAENGQSVIGSQSTLKVTEPGIYVAVITNSNSCSAVLSTEVVSNPRPKVSVSGNTFICQGSSTILTAASESYCQYNWGTVNNSSIEVNETGIYTVTATNTYNCSSHASVSVTVLGTPMPVITGTETICPGASTSLSVTPASKYVWSTGDTTSVINVTPSTSSHYTVTVTDEYGCTGSTHYAVNISELPQISISGRNEFCIGDSTYLTATPGYTYLWSTNSISNSITVNEAGTYTVTAFNSIGCQNSASITTLVRELPELNFGLQHDICAGQTYTYTLPEDPNITYHWSNNATGNTVTVSTAGVYTVTATNQYGCSRSASDNLIIHELPTPTITGESSVCKGTSTMLSVTGGNRYQWSTGTTTNFIMVTPNNETTYSVTAFNEYNCSATAYHSVAVKVLPSIYFSGERTFCEGSSTNITVNGGSSCVWNTGSTSNTLNISIPGVYSATVTNLQGCQRTDTITVTTRPNPVIYISGNSMICAGNATTLTATGGSSYEWSTGAMGNSVTVMPETTTDYTVTGYDNYGCSTAVNKTVNVEQLPVVNISGINAICFGDSTTFTATGGNSYTWSTGNHTDNITVRNAGAYSVTATSANGCYATDNITLTVYPTPVASISGVNSICQNTTAQLTASGGDFYHWNTGSNSNSIDITHGGNYTVEVSNGYNCTSIASINVTDLDAPIIYLNGASSICEGSSTSLVAYGNATTYAWGNGQMSQSIDVNPIVSTTYTVTATGSNGCTKEDSLHITVYPVYAINIAGSICEGSTYSQNGFNIPVQDVPGTFAFDRQLQTVHGCDSTITLTLTVKPLPVMPDSIIGNTLVSTHGSYLYNVSETQYANTFEWRVSNSNWTISNGSESIISLSIQNNGSGILTAKGINECGFREVSLDIYCNVSVDEYVNESNILIYPVPTRQNLNINFENSVQNIDAIQIYDNIGRLIKTVQVTDQLMQLDCSNYAAGNYVIRFIDKNGKSVDTRKIIVNK